MAGKRKDYISWDAYFMGVAKLSALRSKDPSTQVGACIVSQDNKILSMGYNGFPLGCDDDEYPWEREGEENETKYANTAPIMASKRMFRSAGVKFYPYERSERIVKLEL